MADERFNTRALRGLAGVALLLAAVGIYGVMSFASRSARGRSACAWRWARRAAVLGEVVREGMATALAGAVLGSAGAWAVARAMRSRSTVEATNVPVLAAVAAALLGAALVACLVPARRAASVDPMVALRQD